MVNHLIHEKSPYLLQHAHNPVDWYPWGQAAFDKARAEDKPVFLSVGYATCHWCHVMERESFEDEEAARYLNDTFVCIKVDREERPDIDSLYMTACQMLTGAGGWPLTVFLTPEKQPFFAGTYLPKRARFGRAGVIELCQQVKGLWRSDRKTIYDSAQSIAEHMGGAFAFHAGESPDSALLETAYQESEKGFDPDFGGFGPAPKFPTPHRLLFLLRYYHRFGEKKALDMVETTLKSMRRGGVWDHLGFGFHRYSTDRYWLLPHFEKMLYDQALMARACLEAYQITGDPEYAQTASEVFTYVLREMSSSEGAFFAAEDADSEGEEGKFYVWTLSEFQKVLGVDRAGPWAEILRLSSEGNFTDEASRKKTGANILHLNRSLIQWARDLETSPAELEAEWMAVRKQLFDHREKRVRPLRDDKVLADWNGLMITALALGGQVLKRPDYTEAAQQAAVFILNRMRDEQGRLFHRYREGEVGIEGQAGDYAFVVQGLLTLYQATLDPKWLEPAIALQTRMNEDFWDPDHGGYFLSAQSATDLFVRPKELYDGAMPSANSAAFLNLLHLGRLTGDPGWEERAAQMALTFSDTVKARPSAFAFFLMGLDFSLAKGQEIVIAGDPKNPETRAMLETVNSRFAPYQVVLLKTPENQERLETLAPFTRDLKTGADSPLAYVCTDFACARPVQDAETLEERLGGGSAY